MAKLEVRYTRRSIFNEVPTTHVVCRDFVKKSTSMGDRAFYNAINIGANIFLRLGEKFNSTDMKEPSEEETFHVIEQFNNFNLDVIADG